MKGTIAMPAFLLAVLCVAPFGSGPSGQPTFLESALKWPTHFGITSGEKSEVWQRARTWAEDYGMGRAVESSETEIVTVRPPVGRDGARTLRVMCTPTFGGFRIGVEIVAHRADEQQDASRTAHLLAFHLATGRAIPEDLLGR